MDKEIQVFFIAEIRHLAWCCYQLGAGQSFNPVPNADQLESLTNGIEFMLLYPDTTPKENHDNWMKMKISQGWKYGPEKSFQLLTHPHLVPFDELPEVERNKDAMDIMAHNKALDLFKDFVER